MFSISSTQEEIKYALITLELHEQHGSKNNPAHLFALARTYRKLARLDYSQANMYFEKALTYVYEAMSIDEDVADLNNVMFRGELLIEMSNRGMGDVIKRVGFRRDVSEIIDIDIWNFKCACLTANKFDKLDYDRYIRNAEKYLQSKFAGKASHLENKSEENDGNTCTSLNPNGLFVGNRLEVLQQENEALRKEVYALKGYVAMLEDKIVRNYLKSSSANTEAFYRSTP